MFKTLWFVSQLQNRCVRGASEKWDFQNSQKLCLRSTLFMQNFLSVRTAAVVAVVIVASIIIK